MSEDHFWLGVRVFGSFVSILLFVLGFPSILEDAGKWLEWIKRAVAKLQENHMRWALFIAAVVLLVVSWLPYEKWLGIDTAAVVATRSAEELARERDQWKSLYEADHETLSAWKELQANRIELIRKLLDDDMERMRHHEISDEEKNRLSIARVSQVIDCLESTPFEFFERFIKGGPKIPPDEKLNFPPNATDAQKIEVRTYAIWEDYAKSLDAAIAELRHPDAPRSPQAK
jgi:hypothetical protein